MKFFMLYLLLSDPREQSIYSPKLTFLDEIEGCFCWTILLFSFHVSNSIENEPNEKYDLQQIIYEVVFCLPRDKTLETLISSLSAWILHHIQISLWKNEKYIKISS